MGMCQNQTQNLCVPYLWAINDIHIHRAALVFSVPASHFVDAADATGAAGPGAAGVSASAPPAAADLTRFAAGLGGDSQRSTDPARAACLVAAKFLGKDE